jgi:hypothetical protein
MTFDARALPRLLLVPFLAFSLAGCIARTALDVATLPVKAASAGVDAVHTSQAEADRKRGRQVRKEEECIGRESRRAEQADREPDYTRCEERARN